MVHNGEHKCSNRNFISTIDEKTISEDANVYVAHTQLSPLHEEVSDFVSNFLNVLTIFVLIIFSFFCLLTSNRIKWNCIVG